MEWCVTVCDCRGTVNNPQGNITCMALTIHARVQGLSFQFISPHQASCAPMCCCHRPFSLRMAEQLLPEGVMSAVSTIQKDMLDTGDALGPAIINYFASAGGGMLVEWVSA